MKMKISEINETSIAEILGDDYSKTILMTTHLKPQTALEISKVHNIPVAACYRRIKMLHTMGLLKKEERYLTQEGKRIWKYLSNLHKIEMFYKDGKLVARCELRNGFVKYMR